MKPSRILIILAVMLLVSCEPKTTEGVIVEKNYYPSWIYMQPFFTGQTTMLIPVTMPATWEIVIENNGVREDFNISKEAYDTLYVGKQVTVNTKDKKKKNDSKN